VRADISNTELKTHLDRRLDGVGRDFANLRLENQTLKKDLGQLLANIAQRVDPEFFRAVFTVLGAGSVAGAAKALGVANSTFDGQLRAFAKRGGLYQVLYDMVGIRRKLGVKSVERFNDLFAGHQPQDLGDAKFLTDLLDGLEALNETNWEAVRDELIELVRPTMP